MKPPSSTRDALNGGKLVYEDPAAAMNISEGQWNTMVQENLKKHNENEEKKKKDKFLKNKEIQDE